MFPGARRGSPLSNMSLLIGVWARRPDGARLRSTFRRAAEQTTFPHEVAEMALAHTLGDKVEAAYRRGDGFEKRRLLADEWGGVLRRSQAEAWGCRDGRASAAA